MTIEWRYYTGHPSQVITSLKKVLTQSARNHSYFKVGITTDPNRRWSEHYKTDPEWTKMRVAYKTTSLSYVRQLERELIDHSIWRDESWNSVAGGGGRVGNGIEHYLYILLQK